MCFQLKGYHLISSPGQICSCNSGRRRMHWETQGISSIPPPPLTPNGLSRDGDRLGAPYMYKMQPTDHMSSAGVTTRAFGLLGAPARRADRRTWSLYLCTSGGKYAGVPIVAREVSTIEPASRDEPKSTTYAARGAKTDGRGRRLLRCRLCARGNYILCLLLTQRGGSSRQITHTGDLNNFGHRVRDR